MLCFVHCLDLTGDILITPSDYTHLHRLNTPTPNELIVDGNLYELKFNFFYFLKQRLLSHTNTVWHSCYSVRQVIHSGVLLGTGY